MVRYEDEISEKVQKTIIRTVFLLIALMVLFSSMYTVQSGQEGVLLTFNKVSDLAVDDGLHFKFPFFQKVVKFDIKTQKYVTGASASSKDLQIVTTEIALNYKVIEGTTPQIFRLVGIAYEDRVIQPMVQEVVKATTATFTAEELITKRPEVKEMIKEQLTTKLQYRSLLVEEVSLTDFDFSEEFNNAIESKVTAEQEALKAERVLQRVKIEAEQRIAKAEGEKQATILEAQGDAERINVIEQQLKKSPTYIQWLATTNWDGKLPQVTSGAIPFVQIPLEE